ncbi:MAG: hypothetical protein WBL23_07430 [Salinisphaera sp.]|uniref:hypothetical protein n=1 Tax=Salinisphaera sp. TaxID=1914330 RepID=UPI003C7B5EA8
MKQLEAIDELVQNGGEITIGGIGPVACAATAVDGYQCMAMLVRNDGETLAELLSRLDEAIRWAFENEDGDCIDEING